MQKKFDIQNILISQPEPQDKSKSPYHRLERMWDLDLTFRKFIQVEGISVHEFRKQGLQPLDFTGIVFTSKVSVDHYFRIMQEMRIEMPATTKYFCVGESTAKYLSKFIIIRKRKLFIGERRAMDLVPFLQKHNKEKFLFPCSNVHRRELLAFMKDEKMDVTESPIFQTVAAPLTDIELGKFDLICFFSPSGVKALFKNFPKYKQNGTKIAVFGSTTAKEANKLGLDVNIEAPAPNRPSMTSAIEHYLKKTQKKT